MIGKAHVAVLFALLLTGSALASAVPPQKCSLAVAVQLTAAQTKAQLRHTTPIQSPALYSAMRITNAALVFSVGADAGGNMECIHVMSGHPLIIAAAMESVKNWKLRPIEVNGRRRPIVGTLVLRISCCADQGLKAEVLDKKPLQRRR